MRERPILFNTEMVQAILDGRKIQTRRVIKPQPLPDPARIEYYGISDKYSLSDWVCTSNSGKVGIFKPFSYKCPYGVPGDRLYVKEAWRPKAHNFPTGYPYEYKATAEQDGAPVDEPWKSSMFMPKKAARIWLEITDIRVERVQDITEDDAFHEGVLTSTMDHPHYVYTFREGFMHLWDSINAKRDDGKYSWEQNPWVWVVEFKRITP